MEKQQGATVKETSTSLEPRDKSTRVEILNAAASLIVEHGYGACTMRSLSERVNIKAGSLYYHFASKDEIVVEIMNMGVEMLLEEVISRVQALPQGTGFRQRFSTAVEAHLASKLSRDMPYMQVYEHLPPVIKRQARSMRQKYADFWFALLEDGKQTGEVDKDLDLAIFIPYFLGGLNRVPEWFHYKTMSKEKLTDIIVNASLNGIITTK